MAIPTTFLSHTDPKPLLWQAWDHFETTLRQLWDNFWTTLRPDGDHSVTNGGAYLRVARHFFLSIVSLIILRLFEVESVNCNVVFPIAKVEQMSHINICAHTNPRGGPLVHLLHTETGCKVSSVHSKAMQSVLMIQCSIIKIYPVSQH